MAGNYSGTHESHECTRIDNLCWCLADGYYG